MIFSKSCNFVVDLLGNMTSWIDHVCLSAFGLQPKGVPEERNPANVITASLVQRWCLSFL